MFPVPVSADTSLPWSLVREALQPWNHVHHFPGIDSQTLKVNYSSDKYQQYQQWDASKINDEIQTLTQINTLEQSFTRGQDLYQQLSLQAIQWWETDQELQQKRAELARHNQKQARELQELNSQYHNTHSSLSEMQNWETSENVATQKREAEARAREAERTPSNQAEAHQGNGNKVPICNDNWGSNQLELPKSRDWRKRLPILEHPTYQTMQNKLWLAINLNSTETNARWERIIAKEAGIEISETADGKNHVTSPLWYRFAFQKDKPSEMEKMLDITQQSLQVSRMGFGYFGSNFRDIIDTINAHYTELWLPSMLNIDEKNHTFLSYTHLSQLSSIFTENSFLDMPYSYENPIQTSLSKMDFDAKIHNMSQNGHFFFSGGTFSRVAFEESLHTIAPNLRNKQQWNISNSWDSHENTV